MDTQQLEYMLMNYVMYILKTEGVTSTNFNYQLSPYHTICIIKSTFLMIFNHLDPCERIPKYGFAGQNNNMLIFTYIGYTCTPFYGSMLGIICLTRTSRFLTDLLSPAFQTKKNILYSFLASSQDSSICSISA